MTRITLLNYADDNFRSAQRKNSRSGSEVGGFDRVVSYGPGDIEPTFRARCHSILRHPRGGGYWLWKPYFIARTLDAMPDGEWLFYCDSGSYFLRTVRPFIRDAERRGLEVVCFETQHPEEEYTRRALLDALDANRPEITHTRQRLGGFSIWRAGPDARRLARRWLEICCDPALLLDGAASDPSEATGFREHRHDQSAFSVITKLAGIEAHRDPSQFGNRAKGAYGNSPYAQLIQLTRQRDIPLVKRVRRRLRRFLQYLGIKE
ncbi:hypothetical protein [Lewinella sp. IMCC34183]|uniref:hypothetical protein n=1 Tax=Lewinella sp. IMCC34183 TaxID=2248762 RepID=UPI0018E4FB2F|nr:hypothetical protein [Lewinella sp. IMCC34183]